jgi:hypothetical protein
LGGLAAREKKELLDNGSGKKDASDCKEHSIWSIYLQILGLDDGQVSTLNTDRSIKPILKDNKLLHPIAQEKFPDREGLSYGFKCQTHIFTRYS